MAEKDMNQEMNQETVTMSMAELRKLIAEEVAEAKKAAAPSQVMVREQKIVKKPAAKEKMVKITPVADPDRYTDVIEGSVNGVPFKVICDEENEVPESVAKVLENMRKQDTKTKKAMRQKHDEWQRASMKL